MKIVLKAISVLSSLCLVTSTYGICKLSSADDLLKSIKENHPFIQERESTLKSYDKAIGVASQRPNPNLQTQLMRGKEVEGDVTSLQVQLTHTFELAEQRQKRINTAQSEFDFIESETRSDAEREIINSILRMYRFRQIREVIPVYEEAEGTLGEILNMKKSRTALSPEEQVEIETLSLALGDYKLKRVKLKSEYEQLKAALIYSSGLKDGSCFEEEKVLPLERELFLLSETEFDSSKSSFIKAREIEVNLNRERLSLEKAKGSSQLQIGPMLQSDEINGRRYNQFGLVFSYTIPAYQQNNGARAQARAEIERSSLRLSQAKRSASLELKDWLSRFKSMGQSLSEMTSHLQLEKKHQKIEKLFRRGIISTSMVIESHRQLVDFINSRHEFELEAVKSLWNIYRLKGDIWEKGIGDSNE